MVVTCDTRQLGQQELPHPQGSGQAGQAGAAQGGVAVALRGQTQPCIFNALCVQITRHFDPEHNLQPTQGQTKIAPTTNIKDA